MRFIKFLFLLPFSFISCTETVICYQENDSIVAQDSTSWVLLDTFATIHIGKELNSHPYSSQVVNEDTLTYIMMDENKLFFFSFEDGRLLRSVKIQGCGKLNNYSGFSYSNQGILVYNYKQKTLYLLDKASSKVRSWLFMDPKKKSPYIDIEAITDAPILRHQNKVYLSGSVLGMPELSDAIGCSLCIDSLNFLLGGEYPKQYYGFNWGGVYFNHIYHTLIEDDIAYSFPNDHNVYLYNDEFIRRDTIAMGSRYIKRISSSPTNIKMLLKQKRERIRFFVEQPSYANVLYDEQTNILYRIARHPLKNWDGGIFPKPFSIMALNLNTGYFVETPVLDANEYNLDNIHVVDDGVIIQHETANEDVILFSKFQFNMK